MRSRILAATIALVVVGVFSEVAARQDGVLQPTDLDALKSRIGKETVVEGTVSRIGETSTRSILFINFEGVERGGFTVIIRQGTLAGDFVKFEPDFVSSIVGRRIRVLGEVSEYRGVPQIQVFAPSQIEILD